MDSEDLIAEFTSFREVLDHFASKLSEEGILIETAADGDVGSEVGFQVRVQDGFSVLRGQGRIVQTTPEGVLLRLAYLDQPSLKLMPKLLEHYRRRGLPLLELPEIEEIAEDETEESSEDLREEDVGGVADTAPESESIPLVEEASGDAEGVSQEPEETPPLTLDDVESELSQSPTEMEEAVEPSSEGVDEGHLERVGSELLVEAGELDLATESDDDAGEIHLGELLDTPSNVLTVSPELEDLAAEEEGEVALAESEGATLDPGLSWLPDDAQEKKGREAWVILLLILLGIVLGAAFYFFVLRPGTEQSLIPWPDEPVMAQAVPAALTQPAVTTAIETPTPSVPTPSEREESSSTPPVTGSAEGTPSTRPVTEPVAPMAEPMTRLERITWTGEDSSTVVTLWADGRFDEERIDEFRVDGESPRQVVRLRGVHRPFIETRIELGTEHVQRIRTGLHRDSDGSSLHIVADLVDDGVRLMRTEAAGQQLLIYFSKTGFQDGTQSR